MPRCPCCMEIDCDETYSECDDDGCVVYREYKCNDCGCEFSIEDVIKIIKEGD